MISTILQLAEHLQLEVVAEGIETREQLDRLETLRCGLGQGFYFSHPKGVPAADLFLPQVPLRPVRKAG